jgi:glycosyltransferase involved in cell wall biosynthesis
VRGERVEVTFLGNVGDMMPFYDQLDLLALPSAGESFGLVAVEALMRSVPVAVLPDVGGCLALVRPDETGFVVSGGAEGFRRLWNTLDARPDVLVRLRGRIAALDLSEFTIARTRAALDRLTAPDGAAASPLAIVA